MLIQVIQAPFSEEEIETYHRVRRFFMRTERKLWRDKTRQRAYHARLEARKDEYARQ
jgi:hypothetical protein